MAMEKWRSQNELERSVARNGWRAHSPGQPPDHAPADHVPARASRRAKKVREPTTDCGSSGGENFLGSELTGSSGERNLSRSVICTEKLHHKRLHCDWAICL